MFFTFICAPSDIMADHKGHFFHTSPMQQSQFWMFFFFSFTLYHFEVILETLKSYEGVRATCESWFVLSWIWSKKYMCNCIESVAVIMFYQILYMLHSQLINKHISALKVLSLIFITLLALNVVLQCSGVGFPTLRLVCTIAVLCF